MVLLQYNTLSVRPDRVGDRLKYLMSHNLSKCMKFYFILKPRQQHSVPISCFSHELVKAYRELTALRFPSNEM